MSFKKAAVVPAILLAALTSGSLAGCVSTTESDIKTTSTAEAETGGLGVTWGHDDKIEGLPEEIPYLDDYSSAKETGDEAKGEYELTIETSSKDAKADAAKKLTDAGFTASGSTYTTSKWKVTLVGKDGKVVYTIEKA